MIRPEETTYLGLFLTDLITRKTKNKIYSTHTKLQMMTFAEYEPSYVLLTISSVHFSYLNNPLEYRHECFNAIFKTIQRLF